MERLDSQRMASRELGGRDATERTGPECGLHQ